MTGGSRVQGSGFTRVHVDDERAQRGQQHIESTIEFAAPGQPYAGHLEAAVR